ncbi:hypothetical protein G6F27_013197 [Rhizopus arrhizus]|nr:hypothetical protein G6F27_013197 [Rhizopus arrhizus]
MDYDHIPSYLHFYINRDFYESTPDDVKPYLVKSAELHHESNQHDITQPSFYVPHDTLLYTHEEYPPYMNFVEHEYVIASNDPISRHTFIDYVRTEYSRLSNVKNITFRYDVSGGWCQWLSFSSANINKYGLNALLDQMVCGNNEWDEDFYGGSDYVRNYFHKRSLSYAQFRITVELIQGGYGEVLYDYYKCIEATNNDSNDCLLECFRYTT